MLMDRCNFQTTGKWCHFQDAIGGVPGFECGRARVERREGQWPALGWGGLYSREGRNHFFEIYLFFFPGGHQNKSEWHLGRRAVSCRERAASWLTKNEFCLRSALKWARAWKLMIELLINHPRPHSPALHLNSPVEKKKQKKTQHWRREF